MDAEAWMKNQLNYHTFMDRMRELGGVAQPTADAQWHSLCDWDKRNPTISARRVWKLYYNAPRTYMEK